MTQIDAKQTQHGLPIAAAERETGIPKDTLRVWEKRYGFPQPLRDAFNERIYPNAQIQRLKLIQRLLQVGYRPNKVANLSEPALKELLEKKYLATKASNTQKHSALRDIESMMLAIKHHDDKMLRQELQQRQMRMGLSAFIIEVVAPLITAVGDAWERGDFEVFEEHFFTQLITGYLRNCISLLTPSASGTYPKVLLTTVPQEQHGLGILMVEALLTLEGCHCISLGTQTPISDITYAAKAFKIDVVALSFTNQHNAAMIQSTLNGLRSELDSSICIWAGGSCSSLYQSPISGVITLNNLTGLKQLVIDWQNRVMATT